MLPFCCKFVNNLQLKSIDFYKVFCYACRYMVMEGLTIQEIAEQLGISQSAAKFRLIRAKIKPKAQAGRMNFYDKSVIKLIQKVSKGGRPKKKKD